METLLDNFRYEHQDKEIPEPVQSIAIFVPYNGDTIQVSMSLDNYNDTWHETGFTEFDELRKIVKNTNHNTSHTYFPHI